MGDFSSILNCTLGGASFQIDDYSVKSDAVYKDGVYQGRNVTVTGEGYVAGSSASDFATKLAAVRTAFETIGSDFRITGLGGHVEMEVLAARCVEGGPYASWEQLPQKSESALLKRFRFTLQANGVVSGDESGSGDAQVASLSRRVKTTVGVDELETVTITGKMFGANLADAVDVMVGQVRAEYPWPDWTISRDIDANAAYDSLSYTITVKQMAEPLPDSDGTLALDGEATYSREIDEQGRMTETWSYDFTVGGDPDSLYRALRPGLPIRESVSVTRHQKVQWRATFVTLASSELDDLLEWTCSVAASEESVTGRIETYDGVQAIVLMSSTPVYRVLISGRAVGLLRFPKAPSVPDLQALGFVLVDPPTPRRALTSRQERETSWDYQFHGVSALPASAMPNLVAAMARPQKAVFY